MEAPRVTDWRSVLEEEAEDAARGLYIDGLTSVQRKKAAVSRGFFAYFPDAIAMVAAHSVKQNDKHNPGEPVHWARGKSNDHEDCILRHSLSVAIDPSSTDEDNTYHIVARAWRAMAALQIWIEEHYRDNA